MEDDEVAAFLFIQTSISHINTLHNCHGSHYSRRAGILSCARGLQLASERSKKKKKMPLTCPCPDKDSMASSYRPQVLLSFCLEGENPAISCGEASRRRQARCVCITLHYRSSLLLSPVPPAHTKETQTYQERLNPQKSVRAPAQ